MQRVEQIALSRPIWPDDDLKRSQFYFEVESLEAVYLDLRNHAWFSAPFLTSSLFLEVYHNRTIFPLSRSCAIKCACSKLYYGYTGYIILGISTSTLHGSLLLLCFLSFLMRWLTYALQHE